VNEDTRQGELSAHILVVDDKDMNRDLLSRRLRRSGYEVSVAIDGIDALEKIEQTQFDLILLDIMMPRMGGMEVLEHLRQSYTVTELPIIMATAKSDSDTVVEALQIGANDYVIKPLDFGVVLARVKTHLAISRRSKKSQRGGFARLSDSGRFKAISNQTYCPHCRSSLESHLSGCHHCHRGRPDQGWPLVCDGEYPYLGQTIGERYFLERHISSGAVGSVYQARDLEINRQYAAKVISLGDAEVDVEQDDLRERTTREVEVLSRLSNPHIVKIYDVVVVERDVYALLLDHVRGHSLESILERTERINVVKALNIARQVAQGLYEAHQMGIVHCDIKPDNLMIEMLPIRGSFVHILDFGVAEILGFRPKQNSYYGTPYYSAPEQFKNPEAIDHRTDIYALGAVLFHMLEGRPPFEGSNAFKILHKHLSEPLPRTRVMGYGEMEGQFLDDLLQKMMAKDPSDRFADLSGFMRYVDAILPVFVEREAN
jgi:eukaryotic-like serine/threonine-protein kinase